MVDKTKTQPSEGETKVDGNTANSDKPESTPHEKTEAEIAEEKRVAEEKARVEAEEKANADSNLATNMENSESNDAGGEANDNDNDNNSVATDTSNSSHEVKANPNASLFSKARWSAVALDLTKTMIRESEHQDDSFFAGFGNKMRLVGLKLICFFVEKDWYNDLSDDYKDKLNQRFGIKPTTDGSIFEFGEPAGGETASTIESYLKCQDVFKAHFGDENAFDNIEELKALKKDGLTYKQFSDALDNNEITDPVRKKQCEELREAMKKENPMPADDEKIVDYLGGHSDGIAKTLSLTETILKNKNNASLADKVGKTEDLSIAESKFEYTKVSNVDGKLSESKISIKNDSVQINDVVLKISTPEGAKIKTITAVAASPESKDLVTLQAVVEVGSETFTIDNFMKDLPAAGANMEVILGASGKKLVLAMPKPEDATPVASPTAVPTAQPEVAGETPYDKAITETFKNGDYPLTNGGKFDFQLPYLNDKGAINDKKCDCSLSANQIIVGEKKYEIIIPAALGNKSMTRIEIKDKNVLIKYDSTMSAEVTYTLPIKEFVAKIEQLRKETGTQTLKNVADNQEIQFNLVSK